MYSETALRKKIETFEMHITAQKTKLGNTSNSVNFAYHSSKKPGTGTF